MSIIDIDTVITATAALVFVAGLGALMGSLLSLTTLPPLVICWIIAAIPAVLLAAFGAYCTFRKSELDYKVVLGSISFCVISIGLAVGLGAIANANFPGVMLQAESAALAGLAIGCIALFVGFLAEVFIVEPIADKVNECIVSPAIDKVKERFSSKENQPDTPS